MSTEDKWTNGLLFVMAICFCGATYLLRSTSFYTMLYWQSFIVIMMFLLSMSFRRREKLHG